MSKKNIALALALATTLASGVTVVQAKAVKCYGVVKAGQNDCGTKLHSCAGQATRDYDPTEWKYMPQEKCNELKAKIAKLKVQKS
ncbi:DUF2282 domain-containing protein [Piscirickettsia salmonis]|uniref:BufA1 family periplasmic bufferin-type metallophore n=1 Tax=Piscirickettsia salmonis TaxID=1238 RepID=UPI0007C8BC68|nr:hypothetical protein A0O36_02142 [Piscirickettsiaceae bacterium NZ-RLO1]